MMGQLAGALEVELVRGTAGLRAGLHLHGRIMDSATAILGDHLHLHGRIMDSATAILGDHLHLHGRIMDSATAILGDHLRKILGFVPLLIA
jgi:molybdopterin-biosynthesis enzyme MoeA-like protein